MDFDGVCGVVPVCEVGGVVAEEVDGLSAGCVDYTEGLVGFDDTGPGLAGEDGEVVGGGCEVSHGR